jgi:hypothetical protein
MHENEGNTAGRTPNPDFLGDQLQNSVNGAKFFFEDAGVALLPDYPV